METEGKVRLIISISGTWGEKLHNHNQYTEMKGGIEERLHLSKHIGLRPSEARQAE